MLFNTLCLFKCTAKNNLKNFRNPKSFQTSFVNIKQFIESYKGTSRVLLSNRFTNEQTSKQKSVMDAKAYAARNREGSDWFTHRSEPKAQNNVVVEPITDAPPSSSCKAQMIKPVCNSNQWFKHGEVRW